jgi:hypothetical protein
MHELFATTPALLLRDFGGRVMGLVEYFEADPNRATVRVDARGAEERCWMQVALFNWLFLINHRWWPVYGKVYDKVEFHPKRVECAIRIE